MEKVRMSDIKNFLLSRVHLSERTVKSIFYIISLFALKNTKSEKNKKRKKKLVSRLIDIALDVVDGKSSKQLEAVIGSEREIWKKQM